MSSGSPPPSHPVPPTVPAISIIGISGLGLIGISLGNGVGLTGGDQGSVHAVAPVLDAIARRRHHLGSVGAAGRAKLAVNLVGGLNHAALAEGFAFAESMGLELTPFLEMLKESAVYSRAMDTRGRKMVKREFTPHAKIARSRKDFLLMEEAATRVGQSLPLASVYLDLIEGFIAPRRIGLRQLGGDQRDQTAPEQSTGSKAEGGGLKRALPRLFAFVRHLYLDTCNRLFLVERK